MAIGGQVRLSQQFLIVRVPLHFWLHFPRLPPSTLSPVNAYVVYGLLTQPPLALHVLYSRVSVSVSTGINSLVVLSLVRVAP